MSTPTPNLQSTSNPQKPASFITAQCRDAGVGQYQIIFTGASRANISLRSGPLLLINTRSPAVVQVPEWQKNAHPIFTIEATGVPPINIADRPLTLSRPSNFRDYGGYLAADHRHVVWGQLFRSNSLEWLDEGDQRMISSLGLRLICDLRTPAERSAAPTKRPRSSAQGTEYLESARTLEEPEAFLASLKATPTPEAAKAKMIDFYRQIPTKEAAQFSAFFDRISSDQLPSLIHCSNGKDRTGVLAALVLLTLGVDRESVIEDYLLSNQVFPDRSVSREIANSVSNLLGVTADQAIAIHRVTMRADPAFLESALSAIDQMPGGWTKYRHDVLGVSDRDQAFLRKRLLE